MKDAGLPWVVQIPSHWGLVPNRALICKRKVLVGDRHADFRLLSLTKAGIIVRDVSTGRGKFSADMGTSQEVRQGDLVFCLFDVPETPRTVGLSRHHGMITGAYTVFECKDNQLARFLEVFYIAMDDRKLLSPLYSGLRNTIPPPVLLGQKTPLPPASEQAAIVRFLDHADRKFRRYIRAKQKLIKLLEEQKQAIIHRAVTRGLDPNVRLKHSGVEWLGDVPEHWELKRVKQAAKILRGKFTHRPRNDPALYDGPYPFIQTGEVARAEKELTQYRQTLNARGLAVSKMFPSGMLVMTIAANIGDVALLNFEACFPDSVVGFIPSNGVERDFLYYLFRAMKPELLREAPVNTQGNLNVDRIGSRAIALPPVKEQTLIVLSIEADSARLSDGIRYSLREIDLLREYRTRLIADVVTGKLDVREAATQLPEEMIEEVSADYEGYEELEDGDEGNELNDVVEA
jgi:type I restriction enzyme, S subunit